MHHPFSPARRRERSPSPHPRPHPATTLPSIRHLNPDLPPAGHPRPLYGPPEFLPGQSYAARPFFSSGQASAASYHDHRPPQGPATVPTSSSFSEHRISPAPESDQDQNESDRLGPPKKKRRRQALSCTECKRRKIKCDRTHPCGPCARRNEPDKCQWHVIEPVEKYVTRTEWDDLYSRHRLLEDRCVRLEQLVVQLHPELAVHPPGRTTPGVPPALAAPNTPLRPPPSVRAHPLAGPGVAGPSLQRAPPGTPSASGNPVPARSTAGGAAPLRSGSAPPPPRAHPHHHHHHHHRHPPPADRRTCASSRPHGFLSAASERPLLHHQIPRPPPRTAHTARSCCACPPPSPRSRDGSSSGRAPPAEPTGVRAASPSLPSAHHAQRLVLREPQQRQQQAPPLVSPSPQDGSAALRASPLPLPLPRPPSVPAPGHSGTSAPPLAAAAAAAKTTSEGEGDGRWRPPPPPARAPAVAPRSTNGSSPPPPPPALAIH